VLSSTILKTIVLMNTIGASQVNNDVTWENVKFMAAYLWEKVVTRFWLRYEEALVFWDKYGGWEWAVPFVIIYIIILIRRRKLAPDMEVLVAKGKVKPLIRALKFRRDVAVTTYDTEEINQDTQAVRIRCEAAVALGNLRQERALNPLVEAMRDHDKYVRSNVVRALSNYNVKEAKAVVWHASRKDPDEFVRFVAQDIVDEKGWHPKKVNKNQS